MSLDLLPLHVLCPLLSRVLWSQGDGKGPHGYTPPGFQAHVHLSLNQLPRSGWMAYRLGRRGPFRTTKCILIGIVKTRDCTRRNVNPGFLSKEEGFSQTGKTHHLY